MKCVIIFSAIFAVSSAGVLHSAPLYEAHHAPALLSTGASAQFRSQDNIGNYAFGYNEDHATGGTFRRESGDAHGNKVGSYGLRDADGRLRIVNYVADAAGFRADIQTNEPGTEPKAAASTTINGAIAEVPHHAPLIHAAPIVEAAAIHAPVHAPLHHAPLHHAPLHHAPLHHAPLHHAPLHHAPSHYAPAHLAAPLHHAPAHLTHGGLAHYSSAVSHHGGLLAAPSAHHASYAAPLSYASPYGHYY